ncbi:hypothetical protein [Nonomuraea sp. NPDC049400]|uniref:hypothetical protein n=1 Tax=Nonomuraea sp. NPDC049400 TaxID=3364352 RepID=UPI003788A7D1
MCHHHGEWGIGWTVGSAAPSGPHYRWRDQQFDIPAQLTAGRRSLTVVNTFKKSTFDFNEFRYIVQHEVRGVWSTADIVDVGNTASESAHDYHLTGPATFDGPQTLEYQPSQGPAVE